MFKLNQVIDALDWYEKFREINQKSLFFKAKGIVWHDRVLNDKNWG